MSEKKKYIYNYDKICEVCKKQFTTQRYSSKLCSPECVSSKLSQSRKYTEEQIKEAIKLKCKGLSSTDIEKQTGIKKSSQDKIFKLHNIRLNEEQHNTLLKVRWKNHKPTLNGQKKCSKCGILKDLTEFHTNKNRLSKATSSCKECYKQFYSNNSESIKKRVREYKAKNLEKIREIGIEYYEKNKEKIMGNAKRWSFENTEKRRDIERKYRNAHRSEFVARTALYRARRKQACPTWLTEEQNEEIIKIYNECPKGYHVDHIVPIAGEDVCGLHVPWNLQHLSKYQNESKGNKHLNAATKTPTCHQHNRKIDTLQEDVAMGMPIGEPLDSFVLSAEKFSIEHKNFIKRYEWLGTIGYSPKWIFTARVRGLLGGVIIISQPNGFTKDKDLEALISRGATASWTPKNLGSKMISFCCKWMVKNTTKRVFFGYSDHSAGEIGTIYQACNFKYLGQVFGAKTGYEMPNGKVVTDRYFRKTSTYKKYALELGIKWEKHWTKENKYMDIKEIPLEVIAIFKDKGAQEKKLCKKITVEPKSKYVLIVGSNRREKIQIEQIYDKIFGKYLNYPKRVL